MHLLLLGLSLFAPVALTVKFKNCEWSEVSVLGCRNDDKVCVLRRGERSAISIDFTNKFRQWRLHSVVSGMLAGMEMPFDLKNPDACYNTGLSCPLEPGNHTYTYSMVVDKERPKMKLTMKWEIQNEFKKTIVCVKFPAKIS